MDEATTKSFKDSLDKMRAKVVAAKGESVEGLPKIDQAKINLFAKPSKTRETD